MSASPLLPASIARALVDPTVYADHRLHETYAWLRANQPLGIAHPEGFDPFWAVTKHADVLHVSRHNALFHNSDRSSVITDKASDELIRRVTGGRANLLSSLVQLDAPEHPKLRALTQMWFAPVNVKKLEERIRKLAKSTVDQMLAKDGRCDFVNDVALHYPLHVVMEILGVPPEDEPLMLKLTQEVFAPLDPDVGSKLGLETASARLGAALQESTQAFGEYFGKLAAQRRVSPREDVISVIANAKIDGQPLTPDVELGYYVIVAAAGHDTTSSSTAGALWALCENPAAFARIKREPNLIPSLVDEAIRWTTPVKTFMRTATADTELRGQRIAKGDWLMLCYASANRDEEVFADPDTFRVDRAPVKHIAFGSGAHVCLGQHLARMEMRLLFEELLSRVKSVELDGVPTMTQAIFVNGPKTLPIKFAVE